MGGQAEVWWEKEGQGLGYDVITQFQTEELEYMMQAYIWGDGNRTEAQTRGWGLGMGINYGETRQE